MKITEVQKNDERFSAAVRPHTRLGAAAAASDPDDSGESAPGVVAPGSTDAAAAALVMQKQQSGKDVDALAVPQGSGGEAREAARKGSPVVWMFVGQEVRLLLVDLLRTRLTNIPDASLESMNDFFREMYTNELENDSLLAQLYVQQSACKSNTTVRPCRRIRGIVTAFYNSEKGTTETTVGNSTSCAVEICFRFVVLEHLEADKSGAAAVIEPREFVIYRRWSISEVLALRKFYKRHHHVDVFVEKRASRDQDGWQPTSAVDRFRAMHPDLIEKAYNTDGNPFIMNGSALTSTTSAQGSVGNPVTAVPMKKRGRPRKYPKPDEAGTRTQEPPLFHPHAAEASEGPHDTTLNESGVSISVSDFMKCEKTEDPKEQMEEDKIAVEGRQSRPKRATEGVTNSKRRRGKRRSPKQLRFRIGLGLYEGAAEKKSGRRAELRTDIVLFCCVSCAVLLAIEEVVDPPTTSSTRIRGTRGTKAANMNPSLSLPPLAEESNGGFAGKQQIERVASHSHLLGSHPSVGEVAGVKEKGVAFQTEALLAALLRQQHQQRVTPDDDLHSPLRSVMSPANGQLSPTLGVLPDRTLNAERKEVMEEALRPYYRRCIELLLFDLLDCLQSLAYNETALHEREEAIAKCMSLVACPSLNLSALQTLVNHFGRCVKAKASLTELERHLQQELVEDVLYLSRFWGNPAVAKAQGRKLLSEPPASNPTNQLSNSGTRAIQRKGVQPPIADTHAKSLYAPGQGH